MKQETKVQPTVYGLWEIDNARLIAAAPDLYMAAKSFVAWEQIIRRSFPDLMPEIAAANAAIRKAEAGADSQEGAK